MQEQMDVLMAGGKGKSASAFQTPPPTVNGPTPKSKSKETEVPKGASGVKVDLKKRLDPNEVARTQGKDPPATEAAKLARLRRLCEKKPSGKCHVPEELHKRWLHGSLQDREALVEELEAAHWSKDHLFEKNKFQSVYQSMLLWNGTYVFSLIILDSPRGVSNCFGMFLPGLVRLPGYEDHHQDQQVDSQEEEGLVHKRDHEYRTQVELVSSLKSENNHK